MIAGVDWAAPWYGPWREVGERVASRFAGDQPLADALNAETAVDPRFVPQSVLPDGMAYEQFIFERRECPTRDNLHDLFNGLCWLQFPRSKARLNELQAGEIRRHGVGERRGPVRDAVTLFDENGALLDAPQPLWDALLAREWQRLFVDLRPLWAQTRLVIFGHALLEKLAAPRKDLTAHIWCEPCPLAALDLADGWLAARCTPQRLAAKPFTPMPVLGTPGWWPANENFSFYGDSVVFRPRKGEPVQNPALPASGKP